MFNPPHPGRVLREYLGELEVSEAATRLGVSRTTLSRILNARAGISADMSIRLSEALGIGPEFWASLQLDYDLWQAAHKSRVRVEPFAAKDLLSSGVGGRGRPTLLVGFDSAWSANNSGALVGVLFGDNGKFRELDPPLEANYLEAENLISRWQDEHSAETAIILLDQPTIVRNAIGQRPVESICGSPVGRRYGGMMPANTGMANMFGGEAPVWGFLDRFGGPVDPRGSMENSGVIETYPVLTMIALNWMLPDTNENSRPQGRLPKYNPERDTFCIEDWQHVCAKASHEFREWGFEEAVEWLDNASENVAPDNGDQDCLDAYLCLLAGIYLAKRKDCLMVGNLQSGYLVVPDSAQLREELNNRCQHIHLTPGDWVRVFKAECAICK
jgi:addiction module HigA family antidote